MKPTYHNHIKTKNYLITDSFKDSKARVQQFLPSLQKGLKQNIHNHNITRECAFLGIDTELALKNSSNYLKYTASDISKRLSLL